MKKISIKNISKSLTNEDGISKVVLKNISLEINNHTFTTIIGSNGCGKTTFLNLLAGNLKADSGGIYISNGNSINSQLQIGYVWQDYRSTLLPWFNIAENISFPLKIKGTTADKRKIIATKLLNDINLEVEPTQKIYQLSGGQQQLICLLRSVVSEPDLLLLDEPFSALDQSNRWSMALTIEKFWLEKKMPVLFVSHDIDEAIMLADQIILMSSNAGKLEQIIKNTLPRPRNVSMLNSKEHLTIRKEVIDFLFRKGALKDYS